MLTSLSRLCALAAMAMVSFTANSVEANCGARGFEALSSASRARSLVQHTSTLEAYIDREVELVKRTRKPRKHDTFAPGSMSFAYMWVDEDFYGLDACAREGQRQAVLDRSWFGFMLKVDYPFGVGMTMFYLDSDDQLGVSRPDGLSSYLTFDQYIFGMRYWYREVFGVTVAWNKHKTIDIEDRDRGLRLPAKLAGRNDWSFYTNVTVPTLGLNVDVASAELAQGVDLAKLSSETIALPWGGLTFGAYMSYIRRLDRGVAALEFGNILGIFDVQFGGELLPFDGTFARLRADYTFMFREFLDLPKPSDNHYGNPPHWRIMLRPYAEGSLVGGRTAALSERGPHLWGAQFGLGVHVLEDYFTIGVELEGGVNRVDDLLFIPELAHSWRFGSRLICRLGM